MLGGKVEEYEMDRLIGYASRSRYAVGMEGGGFDALCEVNRRAARIDMACMKRWSEDRAKLMLPRDSAICDSAVIDAPIMEEEAA
jgi:hypothetical protein